MLKHPRLGPGNRLVAAGLALVWAGAGTAGLVVAFRLGRWGLALAAVGALWFSALWVRVALLARRLSWREAIAPWR